MSNFSISPNHGVTPLTVKFTAKAQDGAQSYNWDFGDGKSDKGVTVDHTYNGGGSYDVALTIKFVGYESSYTVNGAVIVSREGNFPSDFDGYAVGGSGNQGFPTGPGPLQVIFSGLSTPKCGYVWEFGDGQTLDMGQAGNPRCSHIYQAPGVYNVKLTASLYGPDGKVFSTNSFTRHNYVTVEA